MRTQLLLAGLLLLSACSTLSYQEPTSGLRARVRFVSDLDAISVLQVYDGENCSGNETEWLRLKNGTLIHSTPKKLGMPFWNYNDNAAKEVYVAANRQFNGLIKGDEMTGTAVYSCAVPVLFTFLDNTDYEVFFHWSRTDCHVTVAQLIDDPAHSEKKEIRLFTNKADGINEGCKLAFRKQRAY